MIKHGDTGILGEPVRIRIMSVPVTGSTGGLETVEVTLRELKTAREMKEVEEVQSRIWGRAETVPSHQVIAEARNGGIVLGAFVRDGESERLVGLSHSFPGTDGREVWLYSHMTGILEEFRGQGIGSRMKLLQREIALQKGFRVIKWTFDPLYYPNAHLNVRKLGGIVRKYEVDYYGELTDSFNSGIPSDRFILEWHIASSWVSRALSGCADGTSDQMGIPRTIQFQYRGNRVVPGDLDLGLEDDKVTVPFPVDFAGIKRQDLLLARQWRLATRQVFLHYLGRGYVVCDVFQCDQVCYYLLDRDFSI
ncbi:MAG: hypothetical protein IMF26_03735 [Candidatus Fermentithermobacillus carboniphilus]|uniref:N-acetyltransferase domain-containing protein n=1 Tax=Candidatus Fermentithermobacillus carboniphilus TaxID=3085328 RepID=A0AAT9LDT2_9FIRM|nr:MAG: hypothetical protein IMF26_03735 [Candidatus Fermentithermobacillus carboniphilus]